MNKTLKPQTPHPRERGKASNGTILVDAAKTAEWEARWNRDYAPRWERRGQQALSERERVEALTDQERAVLDASAAIPVDNLIAIAARNGRRMARWARAELARRNGKTGPKTKAAK